MALSLVCHDLFARPVFIWKLRFVCLLDQDASLCHLGCLIIALILRFCEITWKTGDCEEITAYYQKLIVASLYIYTFGVAAAVSERSFMYCCGLGPTYVREDFLIRYIFCFSASHCMAISSYTSNKNRWHIMYLYISKSS